MLASGELRLRARWGPLPVVVLDVNAEDVLELAATEDQQPVKALTADAADPALHVCARVRRPHRRLNDLDRLPCQQRVEVLGELRVSVVDEELNVPVAVIEFHQQVAGLLKHPSRVRLACAGEVVDAAAADRDEGEHV